MFIQNKYTKWYYNIITTAKSRTSPINKERHHILPRSLGGGNEKVNLVDLTPREHYICHLLLTKFTTGNAKKKMFYAIHRLTNTSTIKIKSSKIYEYIRINHSSIVSQQMTLNNPNKFGRKPTVIQSAAIRKSNSERVWSKESKLKMSKSQKQRKIDNPDSFKTGPKTAEHKKNISISRKEKFRKNDTIIFNWVHPIFGIFNGTRSTLRDSFPDQKLKVSELGKIINPLYSDTSYHGWRLQ